MAKFVDIIDNGKTDQEGAKRLIGQLFSSFGALTSTALKVVQRGAGANKSVDVSVGDFLIPYLDYYFHAWVTAVENVVIADNASGLGRIDAIVAYIDFADVNSSLSNNPSSIKFVAVQGTPNASPTAPSDGAISAAIGGSNPFRRLANVSVANGFSSITDANITDTRAFGYLKASAIEPNQGWQSLRVQPTYASASTITAPSGVDWATLLDIGDSVNFDNGANKSAYVVGITSSVLTLLLPAGVSVANSAITNFRYNKTPGKIGAIDWTPTWTLAGGTLTTTYTTREGKVILIGREVMITADMTLNAVSSATPSAAFEVNYPVAPARYGPYAVIGQAIFNDNGTDFQGCVVVAVNASVMRAVNGASIANYMGITPPKTLANGDALWINATYRI